MSVWSDILMPIKIMTCGRIQNHMIISLQSSSILPARKPLVPSKYGQNNPVAKQMTILFASFIFLFGPTVFIFMNKNVQSISLGGFQLLNTESFIHSPNRYLLSIYKALCTRWRNIYKTDKILCHLEPYIPMEYYRITICSVDKNPVWVKILKEENEVREMDFIIFSNTVFPKRQNATQTGDYSFFLPDSVTQNS